MYAVPALIGAFWGAPLVARELESGTHNLAWNQSVTRTRWILTKLSFIGAVSIVACGLLSWAVTYWARHIDDAAGDRITPMLFGARGLVPAAYALFAFLLGVTAGMLIRRTVPAMAVTLAAYAATGAVFPRWIRGHLVPPRHTTRALDGTREYAFGLLDDGTGTRVEIYGGGAPPDAWVLSEHTITPTGEEFVSPVDPRQCRPDSAPDACREWINTLGLREDITYHPVASFWPLQLAEAGVFLAAAALLAGFCLWWIRRRPS
jgi:hypothetical protein